MRSAKDRGSFQNKNNVCIGNCTFVSIRCLQKKAACFQQTIVSVHDIPSRLSLKIFFAIKDLTKLKNSGVSALNASSDIPCSNFCNRKSMVCLLMEKILLLRTLTKNDNAPQCRILMSSHMRNIESSQLMTKRGMRLAPPCPDNEIKYRKKRRYQHRL